MIRGYVNFGHWNLGIRAELDVEPFVEHAVTDRNAGDPVVGAVLNNLDSHQERYDWVSLNDIRSRLANKCVEWMIENHPGLVKCYINKKPVSTTEFVQAIGDEMWRAEVPVSLKDIRRWKKNQKIKTAATSAVNRLMGDEQ